MNSGIVWKGQSAFDGKPIVGIVTGLGKSSDNPKTGPMAQLWILRDDEHPWSVVKSRGDESVCGDCPLRGEVGTDRACYVQVPFAPSQIWKAYRAGKYVEASAGEVNAELVRKRMSIRLGAYGEPVLIPVQILDTLCNGVSWTGYSHAWRRFPEYNHLLMASVDTVAEMVEAQARGWRTFRVRGADEPLQEREIVCPAADEAGHRTTCERCHLCDGKRAGDRRKEIAIIVHGVSAKKRVIPLLNTDPA